MNFITGLLLGAVAGAIAYDKYLYKQAAKNGEAKNFGIWKVTVSSTQKV